MQVAANITDPRDAAIIAAVAGDPLNQVLMPNGIAAGDCKVGEIKAMMAALIDPLLPCGKRISEASADERTDATAVYRAIAAKYV